MRRRITLPTINIKVSAHFFSQTVLILKMGIGFKFSWTAKPRYLVEKGPRDEGKI